MIRLLVAIGEDGELASMSTRFSCGDLICYSVLVSCRSSDPGSHPPVESRISPGSVGWAPDLFHVFDAA